MIRTEEMCRVKIDVELERPDVEMEQRLVDDQEAMGLGLEKRAAVRLHLVV